SGVDDVAALDQFHELQFAGQDAERCSRSNCLRVSGEVWSDSVETLRARDAKPESGDDFVEDKRCTVLFGDAAEKFEEAGLRCDATAVAHERLAYQGRDLPVVLSEGRANAFFVVPLRDHGTARGQLTFAFVDWLLRCICKLCRGGMVAQKNTVAPAVVMPFKFNELLAACCSARESQ